MAHQSSNVHFDDTDEVDVDVLHVDGHDGPREIVNITIGGVTLHFRPKDVELLRSLEACTAEARRDLEEIAKRLATLPPSSSTVAA